MKTPFLFAVCVASLLAFSAQDLFAQQRPAGQPPVGPAVRIGATVRAGSTLGPRAALRAGTAPSGSGIGNRRPVAMGQPHGGVIVAVIDLNHVMNNYVKAQNLVEELQKDGMAADTQLRKDNAQIEALKEKLKDFKPGTPDFKRREEEITQRISDLKVRASIEQRDFQERQMKAMYMIYYGNHRRGQTIRSGQRRDAGDGLLQRSGRSRTCPRRFNGPSAGRLSIKEVRTSRMSC